MITKFVFEKLNWPITYLPIDSPIPLMIMEIFKPVSGWTNRKFFYNFTSAHAHFNVGVLME